MTKKTIQPIFTLENDMKNEKHPVTVVFRKFKKGDDILALFPYEPENPHGCCLSYQHIGQHGAADYTHCISMTTPATIDEYMPLARELESLGYILNVKKRKAAA